MSISVPSLRLYRTIHHLSQAALAAQVGLSQQTLSRLERGSGSRRRGTLAAKQKIAFLFNAEIEMILLIPIFLAIFTEEFSLHGQSVRRLIDHKKIPIVLIGRSIRIDRKLLEEQFEAQRQGAPVPQARRRLK